MNTNTDVQSRTTDLNRQLTSTTSTHSLNDNAQIKTLTDRALAAEKRANHSSNQLALLEAKLAELQSKSGKAEDKWEARVREYENRLRIAGEKIKTEKQGGKERALQLEGQVRWVFSPIPLCFFFFFAPLFVLSRSLPWSPNLTSITL